MPNERSKTKENIIYEINSYKVIGNANESIVIESRSVVASRQGTERQEESIIEVHEETFGHGEYVHYPNCRIVSWYI